MSYALLIYYAKSSNHCLMRNHHLSMTGNKQLCQSLLYYTESLNQLQLKNAVDDYQGFLINWEKLFALCIYLRMSCYCAIFVLRPCEIKMYTLTNCFNVVLLRNFKFFEKILEKVWDEIQVGLTRRKIFLMSDSLSLFYLQLSGH